MPAFFPTTIGVRTMLGSERHAAVNQILRFFKYDHLPAKLQEVSRPFCELANEVADRAPSCPETTVALRKLLEAKDAAVRAALDPQGSVEGESSSLGTSPQRASSGVGVDEEVSHESAAQKAARKGFKGP